PAQRHTERRIGVDDIVSRASRAEDATPFGDDVLDGRSICGSYVGNAGGNLYVRLGIDEESLATGGEITFGGIHDVQHGDVMPRGPESSHRLFDVGRLHEQVGDEHDQ